MAKNAVKKKALKAFLKQVRTRKLDPFNDKCLTKKMAAAKAKALKKQRKEQHRIELAIAQAEKDAETNPAIHADLKILKSLTQETYFTDPIDNTSTFKEIIKHGG